jgi:hypothetical protein
MFEEELRCLSHVGDTAVAVRYTLSGQDILIQHSDLGQRFACLLAFGKADIVRLDDRTYWRIPHNRQVDELLVELIDLLITIRYAHPAMVQLEMVLEPNKP